MRVACVFIIQLLPDDCYNRWPKQVGAQKLALCSSWKLNLCVEDDGTEYVKYLYDIFKLHQCQSVNSKCHEITAVV